VVIEHDGYEIDEDRSRVNPDGVWAFLSKHAYWERWRTKDDVRRQINGAWRVVGCYAPGGEMVGFARAISDGVALAYLADVYIVPQHRARGLCAAMVHEMIDGGAGRSFRWLLHTQDAHKLYRNFGFAGPDATLMERPAKTGTATSE
jgi:GNAT superfamily N-acetyltransferase